MKPFVRILFNNPFVTSQLVFASIFANLLALTTPIFVILVLNRYVSYGLEGTLITLSMGALLAITLEYAFRRFRFSLAQLSVKNDRQNYGGDPFFALMNAEETTINTLNPNLRSEIFKYTSRLDRFYSADNLSLLFDVPFTFLYLFAIYLISPELLVITGSLAIGYLLLSIIYSLRVGFFGLQVDLYGEKRRQLINRSFLGSETLKLFGANSKLMGQWSENQEQVYRSQGNHEDRKNALSTKIRIFNACVTIVVIALGARLVVSGTITIGALIGANILAARAIYPIFSFATFFREIPRQKKNLETVEKILRLPKQKVSEVNLNDQRIKITAKNIAFRYGANNDYVFDQLHFELNPGEVLVVRGANGTGKSTLARMLAGVLSPSKGSILINNINLQQINISWWSKQILYMPQEPAFFEGSIHENFLAHNSDITMEKTRLCMLRAGLKRLCEETNNGLLSTITSGGTDLSVGIRRRLSLARALTHDGPCVIFDEPTENLDREGRQIIYKLLNSFIKNKKTIICFTHDSEILKGGTLLLELDYDEKPRLIKLE